MKAYLPVAMKFYVPIAGICLWQYLQFGLLAAIPSLVLAACTPRVSDYGLEYGLQMLESGVLPWIVFAGIMAYLISPYSRRAEQEYKRVLAEIQDEAEDTE